MLAVREEAAGFTPDSCEVSNLMCFGASGVVAPSASSPRLGERVRAITGDRAAVLRAIAGRALVSDARGTERRASPRPLVSTRIWLIMLGGE